MAIFDKFRQALTRFEIVCKVFPIFGNIWQSRAKFEKVGQDLARYDKSRHSVTFFGNIWSGSARSGINWRNLARLTIFDKIWQDFLTRYDPVEHDLARFGKIFRHLILDRQKH